MASINTVVLSGRITKDLELKKTSNNVSVTSFRLAVNSNNKNENGEEKTYFFTCMAWRGTADYLLKYAHKGDLVGVEGTLEQRTFKGKDGTDKYVVNVIVDKVVFLNILKKENEEVKEESHTDAGLPDDDLVPEDLPF